MDAPHIPPLFPRMKKKPKASFKLLQHWRKLWKDQPVMMASNLSILIASRKALKAKKAKRVSQVIQRLPWAFKATQSKQLMAGALMAEGLDPSPARLKRLRVYAVRYGLLTYDQAKKTWAKCLID